MKYHLSLSLYIHFHFILLFQLEKGLQECLSEADFANFDHFIKVKAKLVMDSREIADKIKLGEEQMAALLETLE